MRLSFLLLPVLLAVQVEPVAADTTKGRQMGKLCDAALGMLSCKTSILIPEVKVRWIEIPWAKPNPCKSRVSWNIRVFGRTIAKGWTCLPGLDSVTKRIPGGFDTSMKPKGVCALVGKALGINEAALQDISNRLSGTCKCLPEILSVLDKDGVSSILSSTGVSEGTGGVMTAFGKFGQCAVNAGFKVEDNKATVERNLVNSGSVLFFKAAEVGLERYISLAGSISTCFVGGACDVAAITAWFTTYLSDSEALIKDQVVGLLKPWLQAFTDIEGNFNTVATTTDDIGKRISTLQGEVASIIADICPNTEQCAASTVKDFEARVKTALDLGTETAQLNGVVAGTMADTKAIVEIIDQAITAFETLGDLSVQGLIDMVTSGKFRGMEDLAGSLKAAQKLPSIIDSVQSRLPKLKTILTQIGDKGPQFASSLQDVLTDNWLGNYQGDAATADKIKTGIYEIQTKMADLIPQATSLFNSVSYLTNAVGSLGSGGADVQVAVASYNRWTEGKFDMPCTTTRPKTFRILGFKLSVNYPKFYRCDQGFRVSFPNHHIPYVKLRFANDSPLLKISSPASAQTTSITWSGSRPTSGLASSVAASASSDPGPLFSDPGTVSSDPGPSQPPPSSEVPPSSFVDTSPTGEPPSDIASPSPSSTEPSPVAVPSSDITPPPAEPSSEASPIPVTVTKRAVYFGNSPYAHRKRQDEWADTEVEIPWAAPTDMYTDTAIALSIASSLADTTAIYISTDGTTERVSATIEGGPIATVLMADPEPTPEPPDTASYGPYANVPDMTNAETVLATWYDLATMVIDAKISDAPLATAGSGGDSVGTPAVVTGGSSANPTPTTKKSSAAAPAVNWATVLGAITAVWVTW